jgi:hypothetical protein
MVRLFISVKHLRITQREKRFIFDSWFQSMVCWLHCCRPEVRLSISGNGRGTCCRTKQLTSWCMGTEREEWERERRMGLGPYTSFKGTTPMTHLLQLDHTYYH